MIDWKNKPLIEETIKNSINKTDVLYKLGLKNNGGNYKTLTMFIVKNNIDISHFKFRKPTKKASKNVRYELSEILVENSTYCNTGSLKRRLYNEGLKTPICEICEQGEIWRGEKMSLILDHINGDPTDNRLINLRIVCPNCNATLPTHCRGKSFFERNNDKLPKNRNVKKCDNDCCDNMIRKTSKLCIECFRKKRNENNNCLDCGEVISKKSKRCSECDSKNERRVERPQLEQLLKEIEELGYCGVGRKYGVSDNAIRKWIKNYTK